MSEILTDYERRVWKESAEDILAHMEKHYYQKVTISTLAENRLRYEATLQAKDATIEALKVQIERLDRELNPFKYIEEEEATNE